MPLQRRRNVKTARKSPSYSKPKKKVTTKKK